MALQKLALGALKTSPITLKLADQFLLGGSSPTKYEKKLNSMADMLGLELDKPITESTDFKTSKSQLDATDKRNREGLTNILGAGNVTNESKLAGMQDANEAYGQGMNQILEHASRLRDRKQNRYINILGSAERAKAARVNQHNQAMSSILDPLGEATQGFSMADLFASDAEEEKKA